MTRTRPTYEDRPATIGAAAAFAAADRRRAALCDAKQAWMLAFDAFKAEEERRWQRGGAAVQIAPRG